MANRTERISSLSSEGSSTQNSSEAIKSKVFDRIYGWIVPWRRNQVPQHGRRVLHRDVEREDFQYAGNQCLSSYYSVFVVRLAIMVMLAILIGLLTILTWHFTRIYTKQSLSTLAYGLRYELLQRPVLRMWNILNSTAEVTTAQVKLAEYVIRRYSKPTSHSELVELYAAMKDVTWALFASRRALNAITINYRNGFVQAFHRDHRSGKTFYIYSDLANYSISATEHVSLQGKWSDRPIHGNLSAIWYREPLDPISGDKIGKSKPIPPDDLMNIAGISQVPGGAASWHVTVTKYSDSPLLSAALPVFDASDQTIVAVVGVTTALYSVGQLMRELVEVHGGHIYLTSQQGYLLATSTNASVLTNTSKGPQLVRAVESEDHVIKMGAQWLQKARGNNLPPGHIVHVEDAKLDHQKYYIDSFFLNLKRLPIVGVIVLPRKFIMGKVDERAFKTLVILISASVGILFIGCVCILILTNGVSKEMKLRAELIMQLDARRRAEASSNYKSQFLANMSHELRTPMAAVIGLLDILICDDCLTNEQYATVTQIRKCSTALLRLLNNILDLSKVESGKLVLEEAEFDLGRELEGLLDMFSVQCINHNVEIVLDLSDDMPSLVRGDSARLVQIFANLISNSIKFTSSGHIIVRGWCESLNSIIDGKDAFPSTLAVTKLIQRGNQLKKNENKVALWFEVDDTGCGIDPSKWESVFESFEQADPSTTRTYGGTGLGLCIVRTLVNKMGGEIKVVKKDGPGTLMQLYMVLGAPWKGADQRDGIDFADYDLVVLLALQGNTVRSIMSKWLDKQGVFALEASDWNELTQILRMLFGSRGDNHGFDSPNSLNETLKAGVLSVQDVRDPRFTIVIDIGLLDLSTGIWREQVRYLDSFSGKAKLHWMLNHDTSNMVKMELRRKGHSLIVNKPLYKAKMKHILEAVIKDTSTEAGKRGLDGSQVDSGQYDPIRRSDNSDLFGRGTVKSCLESLTIKNCLADCAYSSRERPCDTVRQEHAAKRREDLKGIRILLAEDNLMLQKVATIMLEKMGGTVMVVSDGQQAVDALNTDTLPYDLILMDCQMPKMDGYEATRAIRKAEAGTGLHIPIVALTAHAMSSDEDKCLKVGMDAYLTKPIDCKRMVSTILSLTNPKP